MNAQFDRRIHGTYDSADKAWLRESSEPINGWKLAFIVLSVAVILWSVMS